MTESDAEKVIYFIIVLFCIFKYKVVVIVAAGNRNSTIIFA